ASLIAALERALLATKAPYPPKKHPPTKDGFDLLSETDQAQFESFRLRLSDLRDRRTALLAATKTWALHQFAGVFLPAYTRRKVQGGWLDFDDLIQNARALLEAQNVAAWVLFRLDGGIDHILVDEAQDTSPDQWAVIRRLAEEFTAGQGARPDVERTIFVVGDKKQSIYSFQGADPSAFDAMRD
ncbi:MAG: UvrD-helicase domain-containing protein, partial [Pseudomonadota bacterium]